LSRNTPFKRWIDAVIPVRIRRRARKAVHYDLVPYLATADCASSLKTRSFKVWVALL
jgi:hypothetical protein